MTLATHAVVGAAAASLFPSHPVIAFFAAFFSHYVFDTIPHWDYKILSAYANPDNALAPGRTGIDKNFVLDMLRIAADVLLGILIILIVWQPSSSAQLEILALGIIGGMLPDLLQFVYINFPHQPMVLVQRFHNLMHAEHKLDKNKPFIGALPQIAIMAGAILVAKYLAGL
jgi:hypothetical protein